jgi:hypothetical protein
VGRLRPAFDEIHDDAAVRQSAVLSQLWMIGNEDLIRPVADEEGGQVGDVVPKDKGTQDPS